jgi:hypothetical protein
MRISAENPGGADAAAHRVEAREHQDGCIVGSVSVLGLDVSNDELIDLFLERAREGAGLLGDVAARVSRRVRDPGLESCRFRRVVPASRPIDSRASNCKA